AWAAGVQMRGAGRSRLARWCVATWLAATLTGVVLPRFPALAQPRAPTSVKDSRESLASKLALAESVDSHGDRWEWKLTDMNGCKLGIRQTIRTADEPLVTDYSIDLADLGTIRFVDGWVSVRTREPTIWFRTYLRIGEPSEDRGDSFEVRFDDRHAAQAAAGNISQLSMLCRMTKPRG